MAARRGGGLLPGGEAAERDEVTDANRSAIVRMLKLFKRALKVP